MARAEVCLKSLGTMSIILQDKKISDEFAAIYHELTLEIPDEVFIQTSKKCLKTLRFFPTPAEFLEIATPILQEHNISKMKLLKENKHLKCREYLKYGKNLNGQDHLFCLHVDECEESYCGKWEHLDYFRQLEYSKK